MFTLQWYIEQLLAPLFTAIVGGVLTQVLILSAEGYKKRILLSKDGECL